MKVKLIFMAICLSLTLSNLCEAASPIRSQRKITVKCQQDNQDSLNEDPFLSEKNTSLKESEEKDVKTKQKKSDDEIVLTVSADGKSKDEAIKLALRSAIEQTYGAFVSANTSILNDEIVKDEIVTISTGNIKSYKEVAYALLPDGRSTITLNTVVSISKLVNYAQSKGASTEFAGSTFAMNIKMMELNKKNELIVLDNMIKQLEQLAPIAFDYKLEIGDMSSINSSSDKTFTIPFKVHYINNKNTKTYFDIIKKTFNAIKMSKEENEYFRNGITFYLTGFDGYGYMGDYFKQKEEAFVWQEMRNSEEDLHNFFIKFLELLDKTFLNIEIIDNTGQKSFYDLDLMNNHPSEIRGKITPKESKAFGNGLFESSSASREANYYIYKTQSRVGPARKGFYIKSSNWTWSIRVQIPREDISKYSNFNVIYRKD